MFAELPAELFYLGFSILLGLGTIGLHAAMVDFDAGLSWGVGSRDEPAPRGSLIRERLGRAAVNFNETFPFFAAAILGCIALDRVGTSVTVLGATLYFWGRLAYVPLYAFGVRWLRTVAWFVAIFGIILVTLPLLGL